MTSIYKKPAQLVVGDMVMASLNTEDGVTYYHIIKTRAVYSQYNDANTTYYIEFEAVEARAKEVWVSRHYSSEALFRVIETDYATIEQNGDIQYEKL